MRAKLRVANFVILLSLLAVSLNAHSVPRFGRPKFIPPISPPSNPGSSETSFPVEVEDDDDDGSTFRRIPRDEEADFDSGPDLGEDEPDSSDFARGGSNRPSFGGSRGGDDSSSAGFGNTDKKVEFRLVSPDEPPINPRAASYERYKKYRQ